MPNPCKKKIRFDVKAILKNFFWGNIKHLRQLFSLNVETSSKNTFVAFYWDFQGYTMVVFLFLSLFSSLEKLVR
jgi:hypothetical protein